MTEYHPERWVVLKVNDDPLYKVLGGWRGGYLSGDSYQINSGIREVRREGDHLVFLGISGSRYVCHPENYGLTGFYLVSIQDRLIEMGCELLSSETDWENLV